MSKKGILIGAAIGIANVAVGYILGSLNSVSIGFLNKAVREATNMGVEKMIDVIDNNRELKWTDTDIDSLYNCFVRDATTTIDTVTGEILTSFGDGSGIYSTKGYMKGESHVCERIF